MSSYHRAPYEEGMEAVPNDQEGLQIAPETNIYPQYGNKEAPSSSYPAYSYGAETPAAGTTVFGLRRPTFFLALALAVAVLAAAVIGGVLGSELASQRSKDCSSNDSSSASSSASQTNSQTASSTDTSNYVAPTGVTVKLDCNQKNPVQEVYPVDSSSYQYTVTCGEDCPGNDIFPFWSYSLSMCMEACVNINKIAGTDLNTQCVGVAFRADMADLVQTGGNCFPKTNCSTFHKQNGVDIAHAILS